jgi:peptidoglycan/xylan/chitin deacetylase (PgdA/CDA1 family)
MGNILSGVYMNRFWVRLVCCVALLVLTGFLGGCHGNGHAGYLTGNIFGDTADSSIAVSGALSEEPETEFLRFVNEVERISAHTNLYNGLYYRAVRDEVSDFIIDLVHPVSESNVLNRLASRVIVDSVREFVSLNSGGSIFARPGAFVYSEHVLGLLVDIRSFGDNQGFAARRHITIFDLYEDSAIFEQELFVENTTETDIDLIFAQAFAEAFDQIFDENYAQVFAGGYLTQGSDSNTVAGPRIAITFDDGPHYNFTPLLLDALKARGVPATFFVIGTSIDANPDIVKRISDEGHLIGNHSLNHENFLRMSAAEIKNNLESTNRRISDITGSKPIVLRPPYGFFNETILGVAKDLDMSVILWSIDPKDWRYFDAGYIRDTILDHATDGSVILLHDIYETSVTGAIMVIDILLSKGYTFVTVDELFSGADTSLEAGALYRSTYREAVRN